MPTQFAMPVCAHAAGKACLRRIQIAERNETERGQAGEGRLFTRSEVEWSGLNRTESCHNEQGSQRHFTKQGGGEKPLSAAILGNQTRRLRPAAGVTRLKLKK